MDGKVREEIWLTGNIKKLREESAESIEEIRRVFL